MKLTRPTRLDIFLICIYKTSTLHFGHPPPPLLKSKVRMKVVRKRMQPESEKAVDNAFASSLYFSSSALARETERLAEECFKPIGLSPSQAAIIVLLLLSQSSIAGPSYLAKSLLLSPSTMTRLLRRLEGKGFIEQIEYDGIRLVQLGPSATENTTLILDCDIEFQKKCWELLGRDSADRLAKQMNKATDTLRQNKAGRKKRQVALPGNPAPPAFK